MHAPFGNSELGTGYACMMPKLVSTWRALWSKSSGTQVDAPFGLVTLAASGGEGGADIGSMRLAQTGSCESLCHHDTTILMCATLNRAPQGTATTS